MTTAVTRCAAPPPAAAEIGARGYLPAGASLLKVVVALPGDWVTIDDATFVVNDRVVGPVFRRDSAGRLLVPFEFCGPVPPGRGFVATSAAVSYDSRYFGPVWLSSRTVAVPGWTY